MKVWHCCVFNDVCLASAPTATHPHGDGDTCILVHSPGYPRWWLGLGLAHVEDLGRALKLTEVKVWNSSEQWAWSNVWFLAV